MQASDQATAASGAQVLLRDDGGSVVFAWHLPGHLDYGMEGDVVVTDA